MLCRTTVSIPYNHGAAFGKWTTITASPCDTRRWHLLMTRYRMIERCQRDLLRSFRLYPILERCWAKVSHALRLGASSSQIRDIGLNLAPKQGPIR